MASEDDSTVTEMTKVEMKHNTYLSLSMNRESSSHGIKVTGISTLNSLFYFFILFLNWERSDECNYGPIPAALVHVKF